MSLSFKELSKNLDVGVVFYEVVNGVDFEMSCTEKPTVSDNKIEWVAENYDGVKQQYLVTKGFEFYGPKLYWEKGAYR